MDSAIINIFFSIGVMDKEKVYIIIKHIVTNMEETII